MSKFKHNKKRNIGLLNEFFARYMAEAAVNFRLEDYSKADNLWKKHFKKTSELGKELQLFESIYKANLVDRNIAFELLGKIKTLAKEQNQEKLDREKTNLLHEINFYLNDPKFFDRGISDYKTNATVQILLNHWRTAENTTENLVEVSQLEEKLIDYMVEQKNRTEKLDPSLLAKTQEDIDQLVINVFREKIDNRYKNLSEDQRELIGLYVFSTDKNQAKKLLTEKLTGIRDRVLKEISKELNEGKDAKPKVKLKEVKELLSGTHYNVDNIDDNTITFYLAICGLGTELINKS